MKRRDFIRSAAVGGAAILTNPRLSYPAPAAAVQPGNEPIGVQRTTPFGKNGVMIPDEGWRMWPDTQAPWQSDQIYFPDEVDLSKLPNNAPTGGWNALTDHLGTVVTLPTTVEQYHWGLTGFRPYKDEYRFETTDNEVKNGAYYGVSWWWREIDIPSAYQGKRIFLHIRSARQRAEVYLNQKLVGYSIMEELPFECDITPAAKPGKNILAIRITNPGGRLDWVDGNRLTWGNVEFQKSHGFGGIDRALMLSVHGDTRITDAWVLNTAEPKKITANAIIENKSAQQAKGTLRFSVVDPATHQTLISADTPVDLAPNASFTTSAPLTAANATLWDFDTPILYKLNVALHPEKSSPDLESRDVDFGFRWFTTEGLGKDAIFRFNGRRIRLYSSISWGFWALNGLFPTPELAEKEVRVAKDLNLNCLNFHRNLAKEDVLYIQDRMGLLRCLEPGGGSQAVIPANRKPTNTTSARYMQEKIKGMIRAFRSHPSVIHYIVQNEGTLDPNNPALDELFAMMQKEDPSRSIVGSDGFVMRSPEAWTEAYSSTVHKSFKPATVEGGAAGWWVDHTGHFSDIWCDAYYNNPTDFYFYSPVRGEIVEWGEMKGAASSDNHPSVLREIEKHGGHSYDKLDHQELLDIYNKFLDKWKFRSAFPTAEQLFLSIGRRSYETWGQFLENTRINDQTDMVVISGWESTAIENHSGLVDNFRDYKTDPKTISFSLLPLRPVAKQRQLVVALDDRATFDLYLLNDTHKPVTDKLTFSATDPSGANLRLADLDAPTFQTDQFSYLLKEAFTTDALKKEGAWKFRLQLQGHSGITHERDILVVAPTPKNFRSIKVGYAALAPTVETQLKTIPGLQLEAFDPTHKYDVIISSGGTAEAVKNNATDGDGALRQNPNAPVPESTLPPAILEAAQKGTPLLAITATAGQSLGVAKQLAQAGAFTYNGTVGINRASWMGSWYFVREHAIYDGLPTNQAMSIHYQVKGDASGGWIVDGPNVEIIAAYSRDHDRKIGAGTLTTRLGNTPIVFHQITGMHDVMHRRLLANSLAWLAHT
jgi:hypothetical protein